MPATRTRFVDLHLHTDRSDGSDPPAKVVERAVNEGISALAITDHDTVAGVLDAEAAAVQAGIEFLRGVELSAQFGSMEIHIVGLGIGIKNPALLDSLETLRSARLKRAEAIISRLHTLGIPVDRDRILERAQGHTVGRMHVAQEIRQLGLARTVQDAFDKFIGRGKPAFVSKIRLPAEDAIRLIHDSGGLAILAHPGIGMLHKAAPALFELPFDGLEAFHSKHTPGQVTLYLEMARTRGWLVSGGSDCHGSAKNARPEMGKIRVPYEYFERIRDALASGTR